MKTINMFGAIPSPIDERDYTISKVAGTEISKSYPISFKYTDLPPVLNQGNIGSCVAHAISSAMYIKTKTDMSRGFIYGNRKDTDFQGEGMIIRQALSHMVHDGDMLYNNFKYNDKYPIVRAKINEIPDAYEKASENKILSYFRIYNEDELKEAIINGFVVIMSIPVHEEGLSKRVKSTDTAVTGHHCILCVGWDENGWICQNSWGKLFGNKGLFNIDYDYAIDEIWGLNINESKKKEPSSFIRAIKNFFTKLFKK